MSFIDRCDLRFSACLRGFRLRAGLLTTVAALVGSAASLQVRADTITGTGWTGKGANNNWATSGNWDSTPPKTDGTGDRNLFYGQGYFNAGNNGFTTSNNTLSSWSGYRITFQDITGQPDVGFTITGNGFSLFDFGGGFPKIENLSNVTQTFSLTSGQTITLSGGGTGKTEINAINGNIVFSAGTKLNLNSPLDIFGNNGRTLTFNDVVSGSNPLTLQQNSTVELNAANTYTGNTNIKAGTVLVGANAPSGSAGALGNTTNAVTLGDTAGAANASLLINGAFTVGRNITVSSGNTGVITIGGNTAEASTFSGFITMGTLGGFAKDITLVAKAGGSVDFSNSIAETGALISNVTIGSATHTGTVRLSRVNNLYGGVTTINGVVLEATGLNSGGTASSIGHSSAAASNLVFNGGTLRYIGGGGSTTDRLFTFNANGATVEANAPVTFIGSGSLVASGTGNRTLSLTGSNDGALVSVIANPSSGATALSKSGNGTWTLAGANTYSGGTTVNNGSLVVTSMGALGDNSTTTVNAAGTLTVESGPGGRTLTNNLILDGGTVIGGVQDNVGSGGTISLLGANVRHTFTASGTLTVPTAVTAEGVVVGGGGSGSSGQPGVKSPSGGGGGQVLSFTGASLSSGPVTVGAGGVLAGGSPVNGMSGGASSVGSQTAAGGSGGLAVSGVGGASGSGFAGGNPGMTAAGGGGGNGAAGGNGVGTDAGGNGGAGSLASLTGSFYGGGGGGGDAVLPGGSGGIGGGGSSQVAGTANTGGGGGGGANGGSGIVIVQYPYAANVAAGTLTLAGSIDVKSDSTLDAYGNGGLVIVSGVIGSSTGTGGVTITSSNTAGGAVRYDNAMTYGGATTISAGTLVIGATGSLAASPTVTVAAGATLDVSGVTGGVNFDGTRFSLTSGQTLKGAGLVVGPLSMASGSTLEPGNSAGTLTVNGQLVLNAATVSDYELNGSDTQIGMGVNDLVDVSGNLTLDGTLNVTSAGGNFATAPLGSSWRLFTYGGSLMNNGLAVGSMPTLMDPSWGFVVDTSAPGQVNMLISIVPEAPAWAFGVLVGGALAAGYVRRRVAAM